MSSTGQSTQTACMLGEYQPNAGQSACIDADVGFYVGIRVAVGQTSCPAGYQASTERVFVRMLPQVTMLQELPLLWSHNLCL